MNSINELINTYCPNGVKYASIGSFIERIKEKAKNNIEDYQVYVVSNTKGLIKSDEYRSNVVHSEDTSNYSIVRKDMYAYNPSRLNVGSIARMKDEAGIVSPMYVVFRIDTNNIDKDFFDYILDSTYIKNKINAYKEEGARFRFDFERWSWINIPIPPIEIQKEIVRILNKFNDLLTLLENEKAKQDLLYNEFVNKSFEKITKSENDLMLIKEFTKVETQKNKGEIINLAYSITKNGLVPTNEYFGDNKVTSDDTSGYKIVKKNWFVYSPSRIDIGSINYHREDENVIVSPLNVVFSVDESKVRPAFLLYYLKSHKGLFQILSKRTGIEGTGRKQLPYEQFADIKIPLPSIMEQDQIVNSINKFDELCNNVLPLEIEARQKQYEYYRDKLLTFKELVNEG